MIKRTADQMFEKLGYVKEKPYSEEFVTYCNTNEKQRIVFDLIELTYIKENLRGMQIGLVKDIDWNEHLAIYKKLKELRGKTKRQNKILEWLHKKIEELKNGNSYQN